jgi:hypothetical protein
MATVQLIRGEAGGRVAEASDAPGGRPGVTEAAPRAALGLAGALLALLLYAAFAHGAVGFPTEARVQVGIAALAAVAGAAWLWTSTLRFSAPPLALAAIGALTAFAVWSGVSVLWSVAPDQTWIELNRALSYVIVLALAIAAGASYRGSVRVIAGGYLLVALAVTVYALGQKLAPGLHISGLSDLNQNTSLGSLDPGQSGSPARLRAPLDYSNALALFITMAVPIAVAAAADDSRTRRARSAALVVLSLMLLAIVLTQSRGGLIALGVALVISAAVGGRRLKTLALVAIAGITTAFPLAFALISPSLVNANVPLASREVAGAELAAVLLVSLVALWGLARLFFKREQATRMSPERARGIGRLLVALSTLALAGWVVSLALSPRGLGGSISHAFSSHSFATVTASGSPGGPQRVVIKSSEHRVAWWKEATGAWSDRPVAGWGAGSFPVTHLLYRRDTLPVKQPHSVPLQFLAETGVIGALLGVGGYALLLGAGVGTVRRLPPGSERMLAAALLAGGVAYAVHALIDWDWDIPGVTLPALVFLGVLAGARGRVADRPRRLPGPGVGVRATTLAALTLVLCAYAVSAALPSLSASKATDALVAASSSSPGRLEQALATAELAARIDPLSDEGLKSAAAVAVQRGDPALARRYLLDAVRRDPSDAVAWGRLTDIEFQLGDHRGMLRAVTRLLALDPQNVKARSLAQLAAQLGTPPNDSATATGTPLPVG